MERSLSERRQASRLNLSNQPLVMLKSNDQGTFSATLVDLSAGGLCLNTDASYLFGTTVKAYFPDHKGPTLKARVIRSWPGGLALRLTKPGSRSLRRFAWRLLDQSRTEEPMVIQEPRGRLDSSTWGLLLITAGFAASLILLARLGTSLAAGLAALTVMMTTLVGGCLMEQRSLAQGTVRRAMALALTFFFVGVLSSVAPGEAMIQEGYGKLWLMVLTIFGFYFASRPLETYLQNRANPKACNPLPGPDKQG